MIIPDYDAWWYSSPIFTVGTGITIFGPDDPRTYTKTLYYCIPRSNTTYVPQPGEYTIGFRGDMKVS